MRYCHDEQPNFATSVRVCRNLWILDVDRLLQEMAVVADRASVITAPWTSAFIQTPDPDINEVIGSESIRCETKARTPNQIGSF